MEIFEKYEAPLCAEFKEISAISICKHGRNVCAEIARQPAKTENGFTWKGYCRIRLVAYLKNGQKKTVEAAKEYLEKNATEIFKLFNASYEAAKNGDIRPLQQFCAVFRESISNI